MNENQMRGMRRLAEALEVGKPEVVGYTLDLEEILSASKRPEIPDLKALTITPRLVELVKDWLVKSAAFVVLDKIDAEISSAVLGSKLYETSPEWVEAGFKPRVIDRERAWTMSEDDHTCYLIEKRFEWEKREFTIEQADDGTNPASYFCPMLRAKTGKFEAGRAIVIEAAKMLGEDEGFERALRLHAEMFEEFVRLVAMLAMFTVKEVSPNA